MFLGSVTRKSDRVTVFCFLLITQQTASFFSFCVGCWLVVGDACVGAADSSLALSREVRSTASTIPSPLALALERTSLEDTIILLLLLHNHEVAKIIPPQRKADK